MRISAHVHTMTRAGTLVFLCSALFLPVLVYGGVQNEQRDVAPQEKRSEGEWSTQIAALVPCGTSEFPEECGFYHLITLIQNIINWLILTGTFVAALLFAYGGYLYLTAGGSDKVSKAHTIFRNVAIGYGLILGAWLIVGTIFSFFVKPEFASLFGL